MLFIVLLLRVPDIFRLHTQRFVSIGLNTTWARVRVLGPVCTGVLCLSTVGQCLV